MVFFIEHLAQCEWRHTNDAVDILNNVPLDESWWWRHIVVATGDPLPCQEDEFTCHYLGKLLCHDMYSLDEMVRYSCLTC